MSPQKIFTLVAAVVVVGMLGILSFKSFQGKQASEGEDNLAAAVTANPTGEGAVADPALVSEIDALPKYENADIIGNPVAQVWTKDDGESAPAVYVSFTTADDEDTVVTFYEESLAEAGWTVEKPKGIETNPATESREEYTLTSASFLKDGLRLWVSAEAAPAPADGEEASTIVNITVGAK